MELRIFHPYRLVAVEDLRVTCICCNIHSHVQDRLLLTVYENASVFLFQNQLNRFILGLTMASTYWINMAMSIEFSTTLKKTLLATQALTKEGLL